MKKFLLITTLLFSTLFFAQKREPITISTYFSGGNINTLGLSLERGRSKEDKKHFTSYILNVGFANMDYEIGSFKDNGTGFVIETGIKSYLNNKQENKGIYAGNFISYGNIKYEKLFLFSSFKGTFSYFSLFSPEIGYKFKVKNFAIDPFAGIMWQWQIKGKGDIDNVNVDVWQPRLGLRLGYQF